MSTFRKAAALSGLVLAFSLAAGAFALAGSSSQNTTRDRVMPSTTGSAPASRAYLHSYNLPSSGIAIEGYCPVAYFAVNKPVKGKPEYASTYNGVTYHFVSADARRMFDANPEKYIPAYGGWCAFGMSVQDKFPVDPEKFKIVNGELLLFLHNEGIDALELWNKGEERELLKKAAAHWKRVQG